MQTAYTYNLGDQPTVRVSFYATAAFPATEPTVLTTPSARTATLTDPNGTDTDLGVGTVVATGIIEWTLSTLATAGVWSLKVRGTAGVIAGTPTIRLNVTP